MSRSGIFGWSYPAGAANDRNAPWNQEDPPCGVCGKDVDECICPECPQCGGQGDPACYDGSRYCNWCGVKPIDAPLPCISCPARQQAHEQGYVADLEMEIRPSHGLVRSQEQIDSRAELEEAWRKEAEGEAMYAELQAVTDCFGFAWDVAVAMSNEERRRWAERASDVPHTEWWSYKELDRNW